MAEDNGRGIIQWIRLKLDPRSREELKRDATGAAREGLAEPFTEASETAAKGLDKVGDAAEEAGRRGARGADTTKSAWERVTGGIRGAINSLNNDITRTFAAFFAAGQIKGFIADMWQLGKSAEETGDKFRIVFGPDTSKEVQAFIDQYGTLFGLNNTLAQEMTATAASIVQGMGSSVDASAEFSQRMVKLAGDLQSMHDVPIQDTFNAIKSGLVGAWEPMDRMGIVLRQNDVNMRALTITGKAHEDQLTALDKATAALVLMEERQGAALDNATITQDSAANTARNLAAEYQNFKIEIAQGLLPVFASLLDWTNRNKETLKDLAKSGLQVVGFAARFVWTSFQALATTLTNVVLVGFAAANGVFADTALLLADIADAAARAGRFMGLGGENVQAWADRMRLRGEVARARSQAYMQGVRDNTADLDASVMGFLGRGEKGPADNRQLVWEPPRTVTAPNLASPSEMARAKADAERQAKEQAKWDQDLAKREGWNRQNVRERRLGAGGPDRLEGLSQEEMRAIQERTTQWDDLAADMESRLERIGQVTEDLAYGFMDAWGDAFTVIMQEGNTLGDAIGQLGRGIAGAFVGALAGMARSKMAQNVANAIEELAAGFAALANPFMAWSAPIHFKAAGQYGLAAAAWGALAGAGGAGARSLSGGGFGGYTGGASERNGGRVADQASQERWELHVHPGGFNPKDPVHVEILGRGVEELAATDSRFEVIQHN